MDEQGPFRVVEHFPDPGNRLASNQSGWTVWGERAGAVSTYPMSLKAEAEKDCAVRNAAHAAGRAEGVAEGKAQAGIVMGGDAAYTFQEAYALIEQHLPRLDASRETFVQYMGEAIVTLAADLRVKTQSDYETSDLTIAIQERAEARDQVAQLSSALLASEARGRELLAILESIQWCMWDPNYGNFCPDPNCEEWKAAGVHTPTCSIGKALSLPAAGALQRHDAGVRAAAFREAAKTQCKDCRDNVPSEARDPLNPSRRMHYSPMGELLGWCGAGTLQAMAAEAEATAQPVAREGEAS